MPRPRVRTTSAKQIAKQRFAARVRAAIAVAALGALGAVATGIASAQFQGPSSAPPAGNIPMFIHSNATPTPQAGAAINVSGNILSAGAAAVAGGMRAAGYWDSGDNTNTYYVDPNGSSTINGLTVGGMLDAADAAPPGTPKIRVGDDSFLTDVDQADTLGIYGNQDQSQASIRLGSAGVTVTGSGGVLTVNGGRASVNDGAGPCCAGYYTLSVNESGANVPVLQFHDAGVSEGQVSLLGDVGDGQRGFRFSSAQGVGISGRFSGNVIADGNMWLGFRGAWLSDWLDQPVATASSPTFAGLSTASLHMAAGAAAGRVLTSDASGNATWQAPPVGGGGGIGGSGTAGRLAKFTGAAAVGDSQLSEGAAGVGVGVAVPVDRLDVNGAVVVRGQQGGIAASTGTMDYLGGKQRLVSRGANGSANGGFQFASTAGDGSNAVYPLDISVGAGGISGALAGSWTLNAGDLCTSTNGACGVRVTAGDANRIMRYDASGTLVANASVKEEDEYAGPAYVGSIVTVANRLAAGFGARVSVNDGAVPCCGPYFTLSLNEGLGGNQPTLQFHDSGQAEGQMILQANVGDGGRGFRFQDSQGQGMSGRFTRNVLVDGRLGVGTAAPSASAKVHVVAPAGTEAVRIVSSADWSPLNIRNAADAADVFRVDQSGMLAVGSVPWPRLTSFPAACPSGQYATAVGGALTCATPKNRCVATTLIQVATGQNGNVACAALSGSLCKAVTLNGYNYGCDRSVGSGYLAECYVDYAMGASSCLQDRTATASTGNASCSGSFARCVKVQSMGSNIIKTCGENLATPSQNVVTCMAE